MDIHFSNSEDEDETQETSTITSSKNVIESLLSSQVNLRKDDDELKITQKIGKEISQQIPSNIASQNSVQEIDVLNSTKGELDNIEKQQQLLKTEYLKVRNKEEFASVRTKFLNIQLLLSNINKTLSSEKTKIKCSRESQLDHSQSSQVAGTDKKLVKRAKELISQQKCLVKLLKVQKEINLTIKTFKFEIKAASNSPQSLLNKATKAATLTSNDSQSLLEKPTNTRQVLTSQKKTLLKHMIDKGIIKPGKDVFSVLMKGSTKRATLHENGMIVNTKGTFYKFEEWLYKESQMTFSKKAALSMVKYLGTPLSKFLQERPESSKQKSTHLTQAISNEVPDLSEVLRKENPPKEVPPKNRKIVEAKTIRLWTKDELFSSLDVLPSDFWQVGFQNTDLYEQLMM